MFYRLSNLAQVLKYRKQYDPNTFLFLARQSSNFVTLETKDDVAILRINDRNSKVNTLSIPLCTELVETLEAVEMDKALKSSVIVSGKPNCFIAGADIKMISSVKDSTDATKLSREAQSMMNRLTHFNKPIVAAIRGSCLGGGLELALACHYRIAMDTSATLFGFPEVKLGLLPGAGGCGRSLKRCGRVDQLLKMVLTGNPVNASKAKKLGLIDQMVKPIGPGVLPVEENNAQYLESLAVYSARDVAKRKTESQQARGPLSVVLRSVLGLPLVGQGIFELLRRLTLMKTHGRYPAPIKIIDLFEAHFSRSPDACEKLESKFFGELATSQESKALVGLFMGHTECKKQRLAAPKQPVQRLGILGAGLMGAGVAQVSLQRDIPTVMKDISSPSLSRGEQYIQSGLQKQVKRKRMSLIDYNKKLSLLTSTVDLEPLKKVDMVIEAVFEDLQLKHRVVKEVETVLPPHAIVASNTSALPIHMIAQASQRPEKFIGMHYFSPVDRMELLEIIKTDKTSEDTVATAMDLGLRQGKVIIVVKDGPGFYTTRLLGPVMSEAMQLLQEGVTPSQLDQAATTFGWPVGPASLVDHVGVDVACHVAESLAAAFPARLKGGNMQILKDLMNNGSLGRKSGVGIYSYVDNRHPWETPEFLNIIHKYSLSAKMENSPEVIQQRLLCRFVNEAVLCLQEGILLNGPLEGDIGAVFGLGFPPYLGGPFRYLDSHGASNVVKQMEVFAETYGDQFKPCQLLLDHANNAEKRFHPQT